MTSLSEPDSDLNSPRPACETLEASMLRAWLRLANCQFSPRLFAALLARFDHDPQAILDAADAELETVPGFLARHLVRLRDDAASGVMERQWNWAQKSGVTLWFLHDNDYPALLREIPDPPPLLFALGHLPPADAPTVAIVGSRQATPYGRSVAERFARELSEQGLVVVSGGAMGIDTAVHRGAARQGGQTLAVLGCGLDVDYPRENRALFDEVRVNGALISEYPPGAQPEAWRFPQRNRIISGLSLGVLAVEAPLQSGALITTRYALEHGRPVLAVPGNIDRPSSQGCNDLLKEGAILVTETEDILRALQLITVPAQQNSQQTFAFAASADNGDNPASGQPGEKPFLYPTSRKPSAPRTEAQDRLLAALSHTPRHIDAIANEAGIGATQAGVEMTLLELNGYIRRLPGNAYIRLD